MIEFTDNNNKLRRITEFTMEEWNGEEWVIVEDYWDGFTDEEFLEYLAGMPEPGEPVDAYDELIGEPWPTSIERRSYFYDGGSY
jgi:hypothetical protein